jgi:hypothetical protein
VSLTGGSISLYVFASASDDWPTYLASCPEFGSVPELHVALVLNVLLATPEDHLQIVGACEWVSIFRGAVVLQVMVA